MLLRPEAGRGRRGGFANPIEQDALDHASLKGKVMVGEKSFQRLLCGLLAVINCNVQVGGPHLTQLLRRLEIISRLGQPRPNEACLIITHIPGYRAS